MKYICYNNFFCVNVIIVKIQNTLNIKVYILSNKLPKSIETTIRHLKVLLIYKIQSNIY